MHTSPTPDFHKDVECSHAGKLVWLCLTASALVPATRSARDAGDGAFRDHCFNHGKRSDDLRTAATDTANDRIVPLSEVSKPTDFRLCRWPRQRKSRSLLEIHPFGDDVTFWRNGRSNSKFLVERCANASRNSDAQMKRPVADRCGVFAARRLGERRCVGRRCPQIGKQGREALGLATVRDIRLFKPNQRSVPAAAEVG